MNITNYQRIHYSIGNFGGSGGSDNSGIVGGTGGSDCGGHTGGDGNSEFMIIFSF